MHSSNKIIQSLWVGPSLGQMETMCIRSYQQHGHIFHLYTYEEVANIPEDTVILDANTIVPQNEIFIDAFGGYVNLSNQFRYKLLYKKGGWWVDMDTICLKTFDFEEEYVFSSESSDPYQRLMVNTTFVKSLPGATFLQDCINFMTQRGHENIHWGELGVNLISRMIFRNKMGNFIKPPICFCPLSAYQLHLLINPSNYALPSSSYALHWWNEIWRQGAIDKNASFPTGSLYEKMKRKYNNSSL